jgi:hypothetical protein
VRLPEGFFEGLLEAVREEDAWTSRALVTCPTNPREPYGASTPSSTCSSKSVEGLLPSGAGHCIAVRGEVFRESRGFDPTLKFDDIELIRRLAKGRRFGLVAQRVYVSDRRYREHGVPKMLLRYLLMSLFFALGKYRWANRIEYEFGKHD